MLIIGRRVGEGFMIGDNVEVIVLTNRLGQVRLGIKAPKEVAVHRNEVYKRIQQEKSL